VTGYRTVIHSRSKGSSRTLYQQENGWKVRQPIRLRLRIATEHLVFAYLRYASSLIRRDKLEG
jgi:hypothetical protein